MIDVKELRIGNWLLGNNKPIKVREIYDDNISTTERDTYAHWMDKIQPIPLTEEVLKNCNFVLHQVTTTELPWFDKTKRTEQSWNLDDRTYVERTIMEDCSDRYKVYGRVIESLHELQNQIYFYCKKELIYTPM